MNKLDNLKLIKSIDKSNMLGSIGILDKQIEQTWQEVNKLKLPASYKKVKKVIINGMGGSAIGGHILRALFYDKLKVPVGIINSYRIPECLDKETLYIVSSYSGSTEEPLEEIDKAKKRGAKIVGIAIGGKLEKICRTRNLPCFIFNPKYNPCNEPRMGLGYLVIGQIGIFHKCGLINLSPGEIKGIISSVRQASEKYNAAVPTQKNLAKQFAEKIYGKTPVSVASEFLSGNIHTFANQINENSKNFSAYHLISELNHHLMEGLKFPKTNQTNLIFIFINSNLYHPRNQKRYAVTKEIVTKNKIQSIDFKPAGKTKLEQSFEVLSFGEHVSFYLAILNGINPSPIPYVDYFKKKLG